MIVHRNYQDSGDSIIKIFDDKIEFFNPGTLTDGLTVEKLLSDNYSPKARNKLINLMFKEAGLVEKYGSGIKRIINACRAHGNCKVDFENAQHGFRVLLSKGVNDKLGEKLGEKLGDKLSINEFRILSLLKENADTTISELAKTLTISTTAVENNLAKLKSKGIIRRIGGDKGGHWIIVS